MKFLRAYRVLLSQPEAVWLAVSAITTRLPTPLLSLGFLLTVQERSGSYAQAGLLWTAYSVAYAAGVPITGQLVDRKGPRPVLLGCLAGYVPAFVVMLVMLYAGARLAVLIPAAALLGACTPPAGPLIRGSWPAVVPTDRLQTAFALDAVTTEAALIGGPVVVSGLVAVATPVIALTLGGASMVGGTVLLLAAPSIKKWQGHDGMSRQQGLRALWNAGLRLLFVIVVFDIVAYGCLIVGITATATDHDAPSAAGVLLSVTSIGVVGGGIVYGARSWPGSARVQLSVFYAASAAILVVAAAFHLGLVVLGAVLIVAGVIGGPRDTLLQLVLGKAAPPELRTVTFAWVSTITWASYGLGTALGGQLVSLSQGSGYLALLIAGVGNACAAAVALRVRKIPNTDAGTDEDASLVVAEVEPESER